MLMIGGRFSNSKYLPLNLPHIARPDTFGRPQFFTSEILSVAHSEVN